jgi:hypothetical protein
MIRRSTIFMLPPKDHVSGKCWCCGTEAALKFVDSSANERIGACCLNEMIMAERLLAGISEATNPTGGRK